MAQSKQGGVERSQKILDGRPGFRIRAEWGHVMEGGGRICELGLNSVPGVNPLWERRGRRSILSDLHRADTGEFMDHRRMAVC